MDLCGPCHAEPARDDYEVLKNCIHQKVKFVGDTNFWISATFWQHGDPRYD